jgi:hypothetical protein
VNLPEDAPMLRPTVSLLTLTTTIALVLASWPATAAAQDVPFMGVVTQNETKARAGAGRAYYVVGELQSGDIVQVDEVIFGWNKIVPPPGFFSYVAEGHVQLRGDGRTGHITMDRVEVRAGSVRGPGESYRGQVVLNRGDTVEVLEQDGTYYKITPPRGAYVFLPPGSVNRATAQQIAAAEEARQQRPQPDGPASTPPPGPATPDDIAAAVNDEPAPSPAGIGDAAIADARPEPQPADPLPLQPQDPPAAAAPDQDAQPEAPDTAVAAVEPEAPASPETDATVADIGTDPAATQPDAQPDAQPVAGDAKGPPLMTTAAVSDRLRALEERMIPVFFKPLEEQPFDQMIREYEAIQREPLPAIDRQIVRQRLAALQRNRDIAQTLARIHESTATTTDVQTPQPQPGAPLRYDAVGQLLASSVYNGVGLPRMFRVVDPATGRTVVWVEPGGKVDPNKHLGKVVGIIGDQQYDPALKFNVLDVRRIDILEAQAAQAQ